MFSWLADEVRWWVRGQSDADSRAFDAAWGTETARFDLGNYEPSLPDVVDEVLDAVGAGPEGWSFVDLGSGKARAVLIASRRPFARAVGIEHREALHAVAERNLAAFRERGGPRCPVFLFCGDAAVHPLPDGPVVLYLYNPFPADVLSDVLCRVRGPARLAYVNPRQAGTVERAGFVERSRAEADELRTWRVYERA